MTKTTIYEANERDRLSWAAWGAMFRELRDFRELIQRLIVRNVSGQFRQSFLGYLWIVLPPIGTTIVFSLLQRAQVIAITMPEGAMPYPIFALLGATVWGFFTQVVMMATSSISGAGPLVSKIYFPREILVFSAVGNAIVNLLIRLLVVVLTFAALRYLPHWQSISFLLLLVPLTLFGIGVGLFLAPINTMMNDVSRMLEFAFQFGMLLAPTVYPTPVLTDTAAGSWQNLLYWAHHINPVSHYLYALHELVEKGTLSWTPGLIVTVSSSVVVFLLGWRFFHATEPLLAERL
ncbi:MAG: ABC transporter permease [Kiritimatiellae bacterium]|nr:ABC transporter permease [Kiritimatiellia bacterium]